MIGAVTGSTNISDRPVFVDLGRIRYAEALARQEAAHRGVLDGVGPPTVFLLEHVQFARLEIDQPPGVLLLETFQHPPVVHFKPLLVRPHS